MGCSSPALNVGTVVQVLRELSGSRMTNCWRLPSILTSPSAKSACFILELSAVEFHSRSSRTATARFLTQRPETAPSTRRDRSSVERGHSGIRIWKVRHPGKKSVTPAPGPAKGRFSVWNRLRSEQNGSTCEEFGSRRAGSPAQADHNWHNSADAGKN